MHVSYTCPNCERPRQSRNIDSGTALACSDCGWQRDVSAVAIRDGAPSECIRCGNADLWRQKDFPQWLGLTFVALGAVTSSIAWGYHRPVIALGILMGFALLDLLLYVVMPDVLVCYRCRARHRCQEDISAHGGFNHELGERYRQERLRLGRPAPELVSAPPRRPD